MEIINKKSEPEVGKTFTSFNSLGEENILTDIFRCADNTRTLIRCPTGLLKEIYRGLIMNQFYFELQF